MRDKSKEQAGVCPVCGNKNLNYGDSYIENASYFYRWDCPKCESQGKGWYGIIFSEHILSDELGRRWCVEIKKYEGGTRC